jgi:excisionase family DNA binding protein
MEREGVYKGALIIGTIGLAVSVYLFGAYNFVYGFVALLLSIIFLIIGLSTGREKKSTRIEIFKDHQKIPKISQLIKKEEVFTVRELAQILKIKPEEVHDYLVTKKIPFIQIGKRYQISVSDLKGQISRESSK